MDSDAASARATFVEVAREWGRIGCTGFGGPPAHISLLRDLCVVRRGWLGADEFEAAIAACNLLPGPASTQLAIFCAWRVAAVRGAVVGGIAFILPGLLLIVALAALLLASATPRWLHGAGAGASAAVPAVAVAAALSLAPASLARRTSGRWFAYLTAGALTATLAGALVVVALLACGACELALAARRVSAIMPLPAAAAGAGAGGVAALVWTAFKVGTLSYGGGFVIVPLMQGDAVSAHHWMTSGQFVEAVALGQVTPGPVVQTVAVVGYAAAGVGGALLAALVAFGPSFALVIAGARRFGRLRADVRARRFLAGAGPAAIGAIAGSAIPLALALGRAWQLALLAPAAVSLLVLRRGVVVTIVTCAAVGALAALAGAPLPR